MMRTAASSKSKGDQYSQQQVFPFGMYPKSITLITHELMNHTHMKVCYKMLTGHMRTITMYIYVMCDVPMK